MAADVLPLVKGLQNPYLPKDQPQDAKVVVGVEGSNIINVGVTLLGSGGKALKKASVVDVYLSDDPAGYGIAASAPSSGYAIGTDGMILGSLVANKTSKIVANPANGKFDINVTEATAKDFYFCIVLGNKIKVTKVTFA